MVTVSPGISLTNKTDHHDITEIFLKVALSTIKPNQIILFIDSVKLFQNLVIVMDFYSLVISLMLNPLFAFTNEICSLYILHLGNTLKNQPKNLKIVFCLGGFATLHPLTGSCPGPLVEIS